MITNFVKADFHTFMRLANEDRIANCSTNGLPLSIGGAVNALMGGQPITADVQGCTEKIHVFPNFA